MSIAGVRAFQNPPSPSGRASALALLGFVGLTLLVGAAGGAVTAPAVRGWYRTVVHPPGTPPDWVFAPVWTVLFVLMGVAAWRVWRLVGAAPALRLWGWQLLLNALWSPAFFGLHSPLAGLAVIVPLVLAVGLTLRVFARLDRLAGWLLAPYLAWVSYAAWLNFGFWWMNRG